MASRIILKHDPDGVELLRLHRLAITIKKPFYEVKSFEIVIFIGQSQSNSKNFIQFNLILTFASVFSL